MRKTILIFALGSISQAIAQSEHTGEINQKLVQVPHCYSITSGRIKKENFVDPGLTQSVVIEKNSCGFPIQVLGCKTVLSTSGKLVASCANKSPNIGGPNTDDSVWSISIFYPGEKRYSTTGDQGEVKLVSDGSYIVCRQGDYDEKRLIRIVRVKRDPSGVWTGLCALESKLVPNAGLAAKGESTLGAAYTGGPLDSNSSARAAASITNTTPAAPYSKPTKNVSSLKDGDLDPNFADHRLIFINNSCALTVEAKNYELMLGYKGLYWAGPCELGYIHGIGALSWISSDNEHETATAASTGAMWYGMFDGAHHIDFRVFHKKSGFISLSTLKSKYEKNRIIEQPQLQRR